MNKNGIVLGIDPGTARTGFGVLEVNAVLAHVEHGVIETPKTLADSERLLLIRNELQALIEAHQPNIVAIEKLFFSKNVKTAIAVAQARGVLLETAASNGLFVTEYTPNQVKMALTGYGNATKQQVQTMVQRLLKLKKTPAPDDAADALAVAICCAHSE